MRFFSHFSVLVVTAALAPPSLNYVGNIVRLAGSYGASGAGSGDGGPATSATFNSPVSVAVDNVHKKLYVADDVDCVVREIDLTSGIISTLPLLGGPLTFIHKILYVASTGDLFVTRDSDSPPSVYKYTYPFTSAPVTYDSTRTDSVAVDASGNFYYTNVLQGAVYLYYPSTASSNTVLNLQYPRGLSLDPTGTYLYFGGSERNQVYQYTISSGTINPIAGQRNVRGSTGDGGLAVNALFYYPQTTAVDSSGNVYFCDDSAAVRYIDMSSGKIYTVAGQVGVKGSAGDGGPATSALLGGNGDIDIAFDEVRNAMYVVDKPNKVVRAVTITFQTYPSGQPSEQPSVQPSRQPTAQPSQQPTQQPTLHPTVHLTRRYLTH